MHKLIILVESNTDTQFFESHWPEFLHWAEQLSGLRREVTSRVTTTLYGAYPCLLIHELIFDDPEAARQALTSLEGRKAGETLQRVTQGRVTILLADHLEDSLENIKQRKEELQQTGDQPPAEDSQ